MGVADPSLLLRWCIVKTLFVHRDTESNHGQWFSFYITPFYFSSYGDLKCLTVSLFCSFTVLLVFCFDDLPSWHHSKFEIVKLMKKIVDCFQCFSVCVTRLFPTLLLATVTLIVSIFCVFFHLPTYVYGCCYNNGHF